MNQDQSQSFLPLRPTITSFGSSAGSSLENFYDYNMKLFLLITTFLSFLSSAAFAEEHGFEIEIVPDEQEADLPLCENGEAEAFTEYVNERVAYHASKILQDKIQVNSHIESEPEAEDRRKLYFNRFYVRQVYYGYYYCRRCRAVDNHADHLNNRRTLREAGRRSLEDEDLMPDLREFNIYMSLMLTLDAKAYHAEALADSKSTANCFATTGGLEVYFTQFGE